jgi:ABC-2 type transport system ATP-binding protein
VGLSAVAYRRVGEYSKGMARRIGLAQALINDPDLLILDEPTSGLDPIGTRQFKDLIKMLAERGKTVVLSSHLLGDVEDVCDRVCILYGGKQRAVGTLDELLAVEDQTEIVTPKLTPEQLTAINDILRKTGQETIEVRTPRGRLESLFLNIVTEAQEQRLATGGARAGGQMAEFLSEPAGDDVLQSLIQTEPEEAETASPQTDTPEQPEAKAEASLAEVLAEVQSPRAETPKSAPVQPTTRPSGGVDRGVLDNLLGDEPAEDA